MEKLLFFSFLAGLCTFLGAVLLFIKRQWSQESLGIFLGLASGVMAAVVFFDMLPSALLGDWQGCSAGLLLGIVILGFFDHYLLQQLMAEKTMLSLGYLIMLGMALHDLPEGMAIAMGHEMKARTGVLIALAIGIHNIPEGMAIAAPLIIGGLGKLRIAFQLALIALLTPLGTILGLFLVNALPKLMSPLLGFASGIMLYLVIFHLWPQAGAKGEKNRRLGFITGVVVILLATFL
ncbi:MAG: ZIP family metal transporter [Syntrophomonadaceae bacterium]|nr:ZIP family metal transporter [Syntrophomonadaceae bacterium]